MRVKAEFAPRAVSATLPADAASSSQRRLGARLDACEQGLHMGLPQEIPLRPDAQVGRRHGNVALGRNAQQRKLVCQLEEQLATATEKWDAAQAALQVA